MKIGGIDPGTLPAEEVLVLPRGEENIVFRARGLADMDEFDKLCPEPKPPVRLTKAGKEPNEEDANWRSAMLAHGRRRVAYMVVKSLEPSQIEWDTVDPDNPKTWLNYTGDLRRAGFSQVEINRIVGLVWEANCLDEAKLEAARRSRRFITWPEPWDSRSRPGLPVLPLIVVAKVDGLATAVWRSTEARARITFIMRPRWNTLYITNPTTPTSPPILDSSTV